MEFYLLCFASVLMFSIVPSARTGHHELRRELASVKEIVAGVERKLDAILDSESGRKSHRIEATLNSLLSKVVDINRKSQLLSEIHQDNDARKEILQRISRSLEEIGRKQMTSIEKKNEVEIERLDKLSENVQALFQIFGGMNRKLDDLQTRIERMPNACPTSDLKFFITKKIDSLTASTALLSECLECDRESLKDVLHSFVRHPLDNVAKKCSPSDLERTIGRILESKWKDMMDSLQSVLHFKLEGFSSKLEDSIQSSNCGIEKTSRLNAHDIAYSHDTAQELKVAGKGEDGSPQRETPGRIFRKLWRRMTEPINKVGEKMEALSQSLELTHQKYHNETLKKLREWTGKGKGAESCTAQIQAIHNSTKETAQRLGHMESRQLAVQNVCTKILNEVERVKTTLRVGNSAFVPGVTEAYHEGPGEGYLATSCADLQAQGTTKTGIYTIKPKDATEPFLAYCDLETEGGGWTVLQRRGDFGDEFRQNFTQNWEMYKRGFGDPQREFWIGNEKIHILSSQDDVKLRVELQDFDDNTAYAEYSRFKVEDESKQYRLSVGGYHGNATDSLSLHDGKMFSTHDRDNDEVASCCNCADTFKGGWWYYRCFEANLNGPYHTDPTENGYFLGIIWERWRGDYSLKSSEMKIRPLSFEDHVEDP
ncbi:Techylectin-5B [Araneus ventricosus]|uniref:Techylectin-5B n=1 Tax=Araneus ventricosus TaxID=182803 RepID=A0A4Y2BZN8_ARAVE|nr:Techylectin-5B [Araneus ventricosus]